MYYQLFLNKTGYVEDKSHFLKRQEIRKMSLEHLIMIECKKAIKKLRVLYPKETSNPPRGWHWPNRMKKNDYNGLETQTCKNP